MQGTRQRYQFGSLRIRPRKKGPDVWELRTYTQGEEGRRQPQSVIIGNVDQCPTESRARKHCEALLLDLNKYAPQYALANPTFGTLIDKFEKEEKLKEIVKREPTTTVGAGTLEYSTASGYLSYIRNYIRPRWGDTLLTKMRPMLVHEWLRGLDLAPKSKGHLKSLMHRLYEKAMLWELVDVQRNPMQLVEIRGISKRTKKPLVLTVEQQIGVLNHLAEPFRTMVLVAECLGLRVSEVLALQWGDIHVEDLTIRVSRKVVAGRVSKVKTEYSEDELPLDPAFAEELLRWSRRCPRSAAGWLFPNPNTLKPYWASEIQKDYLIPAGKKIGIANLGWHAFRHSYRSLLDASGAPIGVQQKLMRHAQVSTTMNIYGNALMESKRAANGKVVQMVLPRRA
jgi:integrase